MPLTDQESDLRCLRRIQSGDSRALGELYDRYTPLLHGLVLRIVRSAADAEDTLQEAWVQVWKRAASYDSKRGTVAAWLVTMARTRAIDRYRSMASRSRAETNVDPEPVNAPEDPTAAAGRTELRAQVGQALAQLTTEQRRVIEIAYFQGLSQSEVAERLKAPLGTVKSWTRQGLTRLKQLIPEEAKV